MKKKSTTSNLIGANYIPQVGDGATVHIGSDRHPATIIQITRNGKSIAIQEDLSIRKDNNGMSDLQDYQFQTDPAGKIHVITLRKDGHYRIVGSKTFVKVGVRSRFHDYSF